MTKISNNSQETDCIKTANSSIKLVLHPREKDLGDFSVKRLFPTIQQKKIGPWVFFDHMGPAQLAAGKGLDVRPHPHINLATVTYLFEGQIFHRDSLGNALSIKPGEINLMIAGKGIVHSERSPDDLRKKSHTIHGLQLWLALPKTDEETDPEFIHYKYDAIPSIQQNGSDIRVLIGDAFGVKSPVKQFAKTLYVEVKIEAGKSIDLPDVDERGLYIVSGEIELAGQCYPSGEMLVLEPDQSIEIKATQYTHFILIGGVALDERFIFWNFVSSRKERIEQAKDDWKNGKFPIVPGDEEEFIPLPE